MERVAAVNRKDVRDRNNRINFSPRGHGGNFSGEIDASGRERKKRKSKGKSVEERMIKNRVKIWENASNQIDSNRTENRFER